MKHTPKTKKKAKKQINEGAVSGFAELAILILFAENGYFPYSKKVAIDGREHNELPEATQ